MKGIAYFKDGTKMYKVLFHMPKHKSLKEMWLLWIYRNDIDISWIPRIWHEKRFAWGINFGRFHFAKSTSKLGVL